MRQPMVDDSVRLTQDIPDLSLVRGQTGVVRSIWFAPAMTYEVEFETAEQSFHVRALLEDEQMQVEVAALTTPSRVV